MSIARIQELMSKDKMDVEHVSRESVSDEMEKLLATMSDLVVKVMQNISGVKISKELTAEITAKYISNLKKILSKENISENLQDIIIKIRIESLNEVLKLFNTLDINDPKIVEKWEQDKITLINRFEHIGISKDLFDRIGDRFFNESPISNKITEYVLEKQHFCYSDSDNELTEEKIPELEDNEESISFKL